MSHNLTIATLRANVRLARRCNDEKEARRVHQIAGAISVRNSPHARKPAWLSVCERGATRLKAVAQALLIPPSQKRRAQWGNRRE